MMVRSTIEKVVWVGRAAVFLVGLAVSLALVFGLASAALGANGNPFLLGRTNVATAVSKLVKKGPGPALNLVVAPGQPPMRVNSSAPVANLNADRVDGRDASAFASAAHAHPGEDITSGTVGEARVDPAIARDSEIMPIVGAQDGAASTLDADYLDGKDSTGFAGSSDVPTLDYQNGDVTTNLPTLGVASDPVDIASVTVTAPAEGFVILTGSGVFDINHTTGRDSMARVFLTTTSQGRELANLAFHRIPASAPSGRYSAPFNVMRVFPVATGQNTFFMTGDNFGGSVTRPSLDASASIVRHNLTAVFIKTRG